MLLSNPGGPGGSGLIEKDADGKSHSWPKHRFADTPLSKRYDLIGFDPRGVGRSTVLSCEESDVDMPIVSRPDEADFKAHVAWAQATEKGCARGGGEFRKFVNTRNTARDMDVIRGVLGERKVSYVGYSYGTYLGAVYGSMFGSHLGRSVLDSSVDPDAGWRRTDMSSAAADQNNVEAWAAWAAQRDSRYRLGTSRSAVLATVEAASFALQKTAEDGPSEQTRYDSAVGYYAAFRSDWPTLAETVHRTKETGKFTDPQRPSAPAGQTGTVSGYIPVNQTIHCETDWPSDLAVYRRDVKRFSKLYPYGTGPSATMPNPCTFRSFTPPEQPAKSRRAGYPVGLVVQAEGDAQTPYPGGVAMAKRLGSRLITVTDDGNHGQYARRDNTCVDTAVTDYLLDGTLPTPQLTCPGQPRPDSPADGGAGSGANEDR